MQENGKLDDELNNTCLKPVKPVNNDQEKSNHCYRYTC